MNVGELREKLQGLPPEMPVEMEVTHDDGNEVAVSDVLVAEVENRCDEIQRLYLWGEHGKVQAPPTEPCGNLKLVP